jgi:transposase
MPQIRRDYGEAFAPGAFMAKVAPAATQGAKALAELAQHYDVHANRITTWRTQLREGAAGVFGGALAEASEPPVKLMALHAKTGQLPAEKDFFPARSAKPVWLLNRFDSCWRWLRNRNEILLSFIRRPVGDPEAAFSCPWPPSTISRHSPPAFSSHVPHRFRQKVCRTPFGTISGPDSRNRPIIAVSFQFSRLPETAEPVKNRSSGG